MSLLARKIDIAGAHWAAAEEDEFPYYVFGEFADARPGADGMSWWEIGEEIDEVLLAQIAGALFLGTGQSSPKPAQFRFIDTTSLSDLGVKFRKTPGKIADLDLVERHVDVLDLTGPLALQLAQKLSSGDVKIIKAEAFIAQISARLAAKRIPHSELKRDGLWTLRQHGQVQVLGTTISP